MKFINFVRFLPFVFLAACSLFVVEDSALYVGGKVIDDTGMALKNVEVQVLGLKTYTDNNGCFLFQGVLPEQALKISFFMDGYKQISRNLPYNGYFFEITLEKNINVKDGNIEWHILDLSNPNLHIECK